MLGAVFISPSPRGEEILRRIEIVIRTCLGATPRRGELPDNGSDESICSQVWKQPPEGASFQTMDSSDIGMTSLNFPYSHGTECHDTPGWQIMRNLSKIQNGGLGFSKVSVLIRHKTAPHEM